MHDLTEDDMATIEVRGRARADEELRAVGAGACIGHREHARTIVLKLEVLVLEPTAIDRGEAADSDATTLVTKHRFHLGMNNEVLAGKPKHVEASNGAGKVFWQDDYTWQARELYQGQDGDTRSVNFAALTQTKHHIIEGGQYSPITLTTQFDYDQHGNKTLERHLGRSDSRWQTAHRS